MAQKRARAKTSTINRATPVSSSRLERCCRGLDGWPRSWMGWEKDLPVGEKLVALFRPFPEVLIASDLSPKTIQKHVDNLWALGGEIIRDLNEDPTLRRKTVEQILDARIDQEGARWVGSARSGTSGRKRGEPPGRSIPKHLSIQSLRSLVDPPGTSHDNSIPF